MNKKTFTQLHANGKLELLAAITVRVNEVDNMEKTLDATVKRADGVANIAARPVSGLRHSDVYGADTKVEVDRWGIVRLVTQHRGSKYINIVFYRRKTS